MRKFDDAAASHPQRPVVGVHKLALLGVLAPIAAVGASPEMDNNGQDFGYERHIV